MRQMGLAIWGSYASMVARLRPQARLIGHWLGGHSACNMSYWVSIKNEAWLEPDENGTCRLMIRSFPRYGFHQASGKEKVQLLATGLRTHRGLRMALEVHTPL